MLGIVANLLHSARLTVGNGSPAQHRICLLPPTISPPEESYCEVDELGRSVSLSDENEQARHCSARRTPAAAAAMVAHPVRRCPGSIEADAEPIEGATRPGAKHLI